MTDPQSSHQKFARCSLGRMRAVIAGVAVTLTLGLASSSCVAVEAVRPEPAAVATQVGAPQIPAEPAPTPSSLPVPTAVTQRYGVNASAGIQPSLEADLSALHAGWVRVNVNLSGPSIDTTKLTDILHGGHDLIVTIANRDPGNIVTTYGTLTQWPNAGFPPADMARYSGEIRSVATAVAPYLAQGRSVYLQNENEVNDASISAKSRYWRGTTPQYLAENNAFYAAVKSVDHRLNVALTSFTSTALQIVTTPSDFRNGYVTSFVTDLLAHGSYDAADLHFYGCTSTIGPEAEWINRRLPAGKVWISTENAGPTPMCPGSPSWQTNEGAFQTEQAAEVSSRLRACTSSGGQVCLWFSLYDLRSEVPDFSHLGLIDTHTVPYTHRPAYSAFVSFVTNARS